MGNEKSKPAGRQQSGSTSPRPSSNSSSSSSSSSSSPRPASNSSAAKGLNRTPTDIQSVSAARAGASKISQQEIAALSGETKFQAAELKKLVNDFSKIAGKDGLIDKQEFKQVIENTYGGNTAVVATMIFRIFDADGSGQIDFREFVLAIAYLSNKSLEDVRDTAFRALDLNGDGRISKGELKEVMLMNAKMKKYVDFYNRNKEIGEIVLTPAETQAVIAESEKIFSRLDIDNSGGVTQQEFDAVCARDPELKLRLEKLLLADEAGQSIFSDSRAKMGATAPEPARSPRNFEIRDDSFDYV